MAKKAGEKAEMQYSLRAIRRIRQIDLSEIKEIFATLGAGEREKRLLELGEEVKGASPQVLGRYRDKPTKRDDGSIDPGKSFYLYEILEVSSPANPRPLEIKSVSFPQIQKLQFTVEVTFGAGRFIPNTDLASISSVILVAVVSFVYTLRMSEKERRNALA